MTHSSSSKAQSIQIIKSQEEEGNQHVLKLIENHGSGLSLLDILCRENKEVPIFVISICGKTRSGKSFLLNLMIKYLESKGTDNWKNGQLPKVFEWKGGIKSITKGLWICTKVFKITNQRGKEVAILLLDNQGLFDGEQTDGVSIAISGISTMLSSYQMFNLKEFISEHDLESIWRHLIADDSNLSDASATKLVFTVRDYVEEDSGFGLNYGKVYIESEKNRGSQTHRDMWEGIHKTFPEIMCLLLPFPGEKVRKGIVENMKDIESKFLEEVDLFFRTIFDPKNLNDLRNVSTGQQIYETLKKLDGKVADESLSFVNVFTEQGNENKLEFLMRTFDSRLLSFQHNLSTGQSLMTDILTTAEKRFKGKSSDEYMKKLEVFMKEKINFSVHNIAVKQYKSSLQQSACDEYTHSLEWGHVKTRLSYFIGTKSEKNELKEKVVVDCANLYYNILRKELELQFETLCKNKTLADLQGYDESFVSNKFKENNDFIYQESSTSRVCNAIWLREKEKLRICVQDKFLTYVAALTDKDKEWLKKALKTQFKFYEIFTWNGYHWIEINKDDESLLELVGFVMYKNAQNLNNYSEHQMADIKKISNQIKSQSQNKNPITLTCIFIIYCHEGNESCEPVFKVQKQQSGYTFVDIKGRAYDTWKGFEEDNKLPDCLYCYPLEGEYSKMQGFGAAFTWSPASSFEKQLLKVIDVASKIVAIGSVGALGAVVAFPAATVVAVGGAIAAGVTGLWGIGRAFFKIADKVKHDETVTAPDVVDVAANALSITTAGVAGGALLLTLVGRELACAPVIIQSISSLTSLIFELDKENICYLSLANDIALFLLFNCKSIEGAIDKIRTSYKLPHGTSVLETMKTFISENSITFPEIDGETLTTDKFFSDNLKSLLITAIMNKSEQRSLEFLRETINTSEDLRPLQNLFKSSHMENQVKFFEELITSIGKIFQNKRNINCREVRYRDIGYHSTTEVASEVTLAGVCMGLTSTAECSGDENIQQICFIAREILKLVYENAVNTDLEGLTTYLKSNRDKVVEEILEMI